LSKTSNEGFYVVQIAKELRELYVAFIVQTGLPEDQHTILSVSFIHPSALAHFCQTRLDLFRQFGCDGTEVGPLNASAKSGVQGVVDEVGHCGGR
jgi:hypothetical protein